MITKFARKVKVAEWLECLAPKVGSADRLGGPGFEPSPCTIYEPYWSHKPLNGGALYLVFYTGASKGLNL